MGNVTDHRNSLNYEFKEEEEHIQDDFNYDRNLNNMDYRADFDFRFNGMRFGDGEYNFNKEMYYNFDGAGYKYGDSLTFANGLRENIDYGDVDINLQHIAQFNDFNSSANMRSFAEFSEHMRYLQDLRESAEFINSTNGRESSNFLATATSHDANHQNKGVYDIEAKIELLRQQGYPA